MSNHTNPYQPSPKPAPKKDSRSLLLLIAPSLCGVTILLIVPFLRIVLLRLFDEYEIDLGDFPKIIFAFYPELLVLPLLFVVWLLEFAVPSGRVKNVINGIALLSLGFLAFIIACGMALPCIVLYRGLQG
jgi:uncharacterized BrkB/YihY/UPF0761 family membrane protein